MAISSIGEALAHARGYQHVTPLEAQVVLGYLLDKERTWIIAHPEAPLAPDQATNYSELIERLAAGEPLAYLTGTRAFYGMDFAITPDVLVPRPDTETLVDAVLGWVDRTAPAHPLRIIDVGTGSGIIAVTLAVKLPTAHVTAVDLGEAALLVAQANAERHGVADRMTFAKSDLLEHVSGPFDVIAANLPYIARSDLKDLSVAKWEPILALDGGEDGLDLVRGLLTQAPAKLAEGGALFLEIGYDQGERAAAVSRAAFPHAYIEALPDLSELDRVIVIESVSS